MDSWGLVIYGAAGFVTSILSGIAGAGGGFIMTPLGIFLGMSPAQSVSTGKFNGLAVTVGSLTGMKKVHGTVSRARVIPVMVLAFVIGLLAPLAIKALDNEAYRIALGIILLLMIPVVILKKVGIHPHKPAAWKRIMGGVLLSVALALQGIFSGGLGSLVNIVLMGMLGMTALEANLTKRWSQLILNTTILLSVIGAGLIIWSAVAVGIFTTFAGGYVGGRMAVHKGDEFIVRIMVILMAVSAIALIVGA
ncbi:MAG: rane protein of unknown function [Candidatus Saccharibacteria bacterium]|nr:rane protein of unknown function [Candidatus Saccharibacteria bacterium]